MPLFALLFLILACGCSRTATDDPVTSGDPYEGSLTRLAWQMRDRGEPLDSAIAVQLRAVKEVRAGHSTDNPVEALAQLGNFYYSAGDIANALKYQQEAADTLARRPDLADTEGAVQLYGDLCVLYSTLGMTDKALDMNDRALATSRRLGGRLISDVYTRRVYIFNASGRLDSAMRCYQLGLAALRHSETNRDKEFLIGVLNLDKAGFIIENLDHFRDSLRVAIDILEPALADMEEDRFDRMDCILSLGRAYMADGRTARGLPMIEQAVSMYRRADDLQGEAYATQSLMESYRRAGMADSMMSLFPRYKVLCDTLYNESTTTAAIASELRYQTSLRERENQALADALELSQQRAVILILSALLVLALASVVILFTLRRLREAKDKSRRQRESIHRLLEHQRELDSRLDDLTAQANDNEMAEIHSLSFSGALHGDNEMKFRKVFAGAYPNFLPNLRKDFPGLTSNDELLCMLIYIHQSTEEISLTLGISRASVNSARYRLRKKLSLTPETDLDTFLQRRRGR